VSDDYPAGVFHDARRRAREGRAVHFRSRAERAFGQNPGGPRLHGRLISFPRGLQPHADPVVGCQYSVLRQKVESTLSCRYPIQYQLSVFFTVWLSIKLIISAWISSSVISAPSDGRYSRERDASSHQGAGASGACNPGHVLKKPAPAAGTAGAKVPCCRVDSTRRLQVAPIIAQLE